MANWKYLEKALEVHFQERYGDQENAIIKRNVRSGSYSEVNSDVDIFNVDGLPNMIFEAKHRSASNLGLVNAYEKAYDSFTKTTLYSQKPNLKNEMFFYMTAWVKLSAYSSEYTPLHVMQLEDLETYLEMQEMSVGEAWNLYHAQMKVSSCWYMEQIQKVNTVYAPQKIRRYKLDEDPIAVLAMRKKGSKKTVIALEPQCPIIIPTLNLET